jgi:hypothetical protein
MPIGAKLGGQLAFLSALLCALPGCYGLPCVVMALSDLLLAGLSLLCCLPTCGLSLFLCTLPLEICFFATGLCGLPGPLYSLLVIFCGGFPCMLICSMAGWAGLLKPLEPLAEPLSSMFSLCESLSTSLCVLCPLYESYGSSYKCIFL